MFGLLDSVVDLAKDVAEVVVAPIEVVVDIADAVVKPIVEVAHDVVEEVKSLKE